MSSTTMHTAGATFPYVSFTQPMPPAQAFAPTPAMTALPQRPTYYPPILYWYPSPPVSPPTPQQQPQQQPQQILTTPIHQHAQPQQPHLTALPLPQPQPVHTVQPNPAFSYYTSTTSTTSSSQLCPGGQAGPYIGPCMIIMRGLPVTVSIQDIMNYFQGFPEVGLPFIFLPLLLASLLSFPLCLLAVFVWLGHFHVTDSIYGKLYFCVRSSSKWKTFCKAARCIFFNGDAFKS